MPPETDVEAQPLLADAGAGGDGDAAVRGACVQRAGAAAVARRPLCQGARARERCALRETQPLSRAFAGHTARLRPARVS